MIRGVMAAAHNLVADQVATPPGVGQPWAGGYVAGEIEYPDGRAFTLVLAEKSAELSSVQWKTNTIFDGVSSTYDGYENTSLLHDAGHPAATLCAEYDGGGHSDWYLPAPDEIAVVYLNLAPTQTSVPEFLYGGNQALSAFDTNDFYWTSMEGSGTNRAYRFAMINGLLSYNWKNAYHRARAIRRVQIHT